MDNAVAIPIRNIYALLAYAWNCLELADEDTVGALSAETPKDLLALILSDGVRRLLRRGAYREYRVRSEDLRSPRGSIDLTDSIARALRARGELACRFDELVYDVPHNRVIKAGIGMLLRCPLPDALHATLRSAWLLMSDIAEVALTEQLLRSIRVPRGHRLYGLLIDVCWLLLRTMLPTENARGYVLRDFTRDDDMMAHLFEAFVRNFLHHEVTSVRVTREQLRWADAAGTSSGLALLPRMTTDISILTPGRHSILETKFVRQPFRTFEESDRLKLRSSHLYQLFAYVKNVRACVPSRETVDGVLVYASVGQGIVECVRLGDVTIAVHTIDLSAEWPELRRQLLALPSAALTDW